MVVDNRHFQERHVLRQRPLEKHVLNPGSAYFAFLSRLTVRLDGRCAIDFLRGPCSIFTGEVPVCRVVQADEARLRARVLARADHRDIRCVAGAVVVRLNPVAVLVDQIPQVLVGLRETVIEIVSCNDVDALLAQVEDLVLIGLAAARLITGALKEMIDLAGSLSNLLHGHARDVLGEFVLSLGDLREIIKTKIRRLAKVRDLLRGVSDAAGHRRLAGPHTALAQLGCREAHQHELVNGAGAVHRRRVRMLVILGELQADAIQIVRHVDDPDRDRL